MNITHVIVNGNETPAPATGQWTVTEAVPLPAGRFFRKVLSLRFPMDTNADGIIVDSGSTLLNGVFRPYDYEALATSETSLQGSLSQKDGAVVVTLDAPREVREVRLAPGAAVGAGFSLELFRMDGEAISDNPTVSAVVSQNKASLTVPFRDVRFAIRLKSPGGHGVLQKEDVTEFHVSSYPTVARFAIADPEALDSVVPFWMEAGELRSETPEEEAPRQVGQAFSAELQKHLESRLLALKKNAQADGAIHTPPPFLEAALLVESDAPCILEITGFTVSYHYALGSFPSGEKKKVLRFSGAHIHSEEVLFQLPVNASVIGASITILESLGTDRPLSLDSEAGELGSVLTQKDAVMVGGERWAGRKIAPAQPVSVSSVGVALMALSPGTQVCLELRRDHQGQPAGSTTASATYTLNGVGNPHWAVFSLAESLVLDAQPCWLLMKASSGTALWLAQAGEGSAHFWAVSEDSALRGEVSTIAGLQPLYSLLSRGKSGMREKASTLRIGNTAISGVTDERGMKTYDLSSAVITFLQAQKPGSTTATISLTLTANGRGLVTVYPPSVIFDV